MILGLALAACDNQPPKLLSVNGGEYEEQWLGDGFSAQGINVVPGETIDLVVEYRDPEGDAVEVRFSDMPGHVTFDPWGTRGTLDVFDEVLDTGVWERTSVIILLDDGKPQAWAEYELFFNYPYDEEGGTER
jgi:hypothetical protein